jgi:SAM-dependent methyltransferase
MRVRDSGMPEEEYWESLVDVERTMAAFQFAQYHDVAEIGCGYGTFSLPAAKAISGLLYAYDIDAEMVDRTKHRLSSLTNAIVKHRDVFEHGLDGNVDAVLLFNILHCEAPVQLLQIAASAAPTILVTHWQSIETPRGPAFDIRPRPEQIADWAKHCNLSVAEQFELPPWHFGMTLKRR